jgi:hypothetical protein
VITTKITPELTSKLSYRYYDFDNDTPRIIFPCWIHYDSTGTNFPGPTPSAHGPCGPAGFEGTVSSLSPQYTKQNAGANLNWRPDQEWNFNAAYGYERYQYRQFDANVTNENSVKGSVDWKPAVWFMARATGYYGDRRYDIYDYINFVRNIQFPDLSASGFTPTGTSWFYSPAYRQFMFDNRQQTKADFTVDIVAIRGLTISPSLKYKDDYYGLNPLNQLGLTDNQSLSGGVDVAYVVTPELTFAFTYYYEDYHQVFYSNESNQTPTAAQGLIINNDKVYVNTVTAAMHWAAIPEKLNIDVRYAVSDAIDKQNCSKCLVTGATVPTPFPDNKTLFERLDATATYKLDPLWVSQMGFKGDILAKLRYTWERNSVSNWQNDPVAPFSPAINPTEIFLAFYNPNYNVQVIAGSLVALW